MEQVSIFDLFDDETAAQFKPKKATDWKWSFADYPEKNGLQVFSCFACGGGSTMGYKLAGCNVLGCVEIDPEMNKTYIQNHHPKYNFLMDIREFNALPNEEIPAELFNLDILDGSPPCTTFSIAGDREKSWGKKKKFREGQKEQTLDDLSFVFIETVAKLRPKCVIMENVEGLIQGAAWSYVQKIYKQFSDAGYHVHHWLLKGENVGIPQTRHRVFFVAIRKEYGIVPRELDMSFHYEPVVYGLAKQGTGQDVNKNTEAYKWLLKTQPGDKRLADPVVREGLPEKLFMHKVFYEDAIPQTIAATSDYYRGTDKTYISIEDIINIQTFPQDYDFIERTRKNVQYICGMSVPPIMIKRIVERLQELRVFERIATKDAAAPAVVGM